MLAVITKLLLMELTRKSSLYMELPHGGQEMELWDRVRAHIALLSEISLSMTCDAQVSNSKWERVILR